MRPKKPERVIIRREFDPYMRVWGYLAFYPDSKANPGCIQCQRVYKVSSDCNGNDFRNWRVGCLDEVSLDYFYKRKIVKARSSYANKVIAILKRKYWDSDFKAYEKR